jgi:uncharacterized protein YjdB
VGVFRSALATFVTLVAVAACGDKLYPAPDAGLPPADKTVYAVFVSPSSAAVVAGGTTSFTASVDAGAGVANRAAVTWSSSDTTVARVATDGKATGVKPGTASIKATSVADPKVFGTATVTVGGAVTAGVSP